MITGAAKMMEFGAIAFSNSSEIYAIYTGTSVHELFTGLPIIHVQLAESLSYQISRVIVRNHDESTSAFVREVLFDSNAQRGFAISVPSIGSYTLTCGSSDGLLCRSLVHNGETTFLANSAGDTFYDNVGISSENGICHPPTQAATGTRASTRDLTTEFTDDLNLANRRRRRFHSSFGYTFCVWR
jgi:hypothetical protein